MIPKVLAKQALGPIQGDGLGPFAKTTADQVSALRQITNIVSAVIGILTVAATLWFLVQLLIGGINWISSGGDKGKLETARNRITNAFLGLIIVVAGWSILSIAGKFIGYDILISDPGALLGKFKF